MPRTQCPASSLKRSDSLKINGVIAAGTYQYREIQHQEAARLDVHPILDGQGAETIGLKKGENAQNRCRAEDQAERRRPDFLHFVHYPVS